MSKRWTKVEVAWLEKHAGDKSLDELAARFKTDPGTVQKKLDELRKKAGAAVAGDDALQLYQTGVQALYAGDWAAAIEQLDKAAADGSRELAARARQYAAVARQRAGDPAQAAAADPWVRAVYDKNRGALDEALAACLADGRADKDGRFAYLAAVVCSLRGDLAGGRAHLERAVQLDPRNRAHAHHDPDLRPLHDERPG